MREGILWKTRRRERSR